MIGYNRKMRLALAKLGKNIADFHAPEPISDEAWQRFTNNCVVALMAGGESNRFSSVLGNAKSNKSAFELPNGDSMIEMTIRMYRDAGIKNFAALVFHNSHSVEKLLGDGSKLGVRITYSHDPKQAVGKGGAVRNALDNGSIPDDKYLIVHNPDDVIVDFKGSFPRFLASGQIEAEATGAIATVAVTPATPYAYSGMKVINNVVKQIEMYPMIPVPAHIGVTVFSPSAYPYFRELFSLKRKSDFEAVLFPRLSEEGKLHAVALDQGKWIAVNDMKGYKELLKHLD